jgi:hypothetical protein
MQQKKAFAGRKEKEKEKNWQTNHNQPVKIIPPKI